MKNLAIYKNDICLIAGSGLFVNEVAHYLNLKNLLGQIIIINDNKYLQKYFKNNYKQFNIKNFEKIISFIKSRNLQKIIIIGYVDLTPLDKINLSLKSKLLISKDIFINNINDQSKILKKLWSLGSVVNIYHYYLTVKFLQHDLHQLHQKSKNYYRPLLLLCH